jgi:hypothetical protein
MQKENGASEQSSKQEDTHRYLAYVAQFKALMAQRSQAAVQPSIKEEVKEESAIPSRAIAPQPAISTDAGAEALVDDRNGAGKRGRDSPAGSGDLYVTAKRSKVEDSEGTVASLLATIDGCPACVDRSCMHLSDRLSDSTHSCRPCAHGDRDHFSAAVKRHACQDNR